MDKYTFWAYLKANIFISDEDFQVMWETAEHHYDYKCKSQINEEEKGILWLARNRRRFYKKDIEHRNTMAMEFRDIDLMLKTLEMSVYNSDKEKAQRGFALSIRLRKIIQELSDKSNEINKQLQEKV